MSRHDGTAQEDAQSERTRDVVMNWLDDQHRLARAVGHARAKSSRNTLDCCMLRPSNPDECPTEGDATENLRIGYTCMTRAGGSRCGGVQSLDLLNKLPDDTDVHARKWVDNYHAI